MATFQLLRHRRNEPQAFLYAFDLLELNGTDLRREPIEVRKATLASILRKSRPGVRLNEHLEHHCGADGVPARLQDGAGGDCLEAPGIALPIGPIARLAQVQESRGSCGEAGGGGGVAVKRPMMTDAIAKRKSGRQSEGHQLQHPTSSRTGGNCGCLKLSSDFVRDNEVISQRKMGSVWKAWAMWKKDWGADEGDP